MLQSASQKFITVLVVLLILGAFGYYVYSKNDVPATTPDLSANGDTVLGEDILSLADKLNTITIDQSVFTSPLFESLVDHDTPLSPETQGRPNPFASFSFGGGSTST